MEQDPAPNVIIEESLRLACLNAQTVAQGLDLNLKPIKQDRDGIRFMSVLTPLVE